MTINVGFSLHVFTCDVRDADPSPEFYSDNRETRAFDLQRYAWSHRLKSIVSGLEKRKCYFTGRHNYFTVELDDVPSGWEYRVYFDVQRKDADAVVLLVQSAYGVQAEGLAATVYHKRVAFGVVVREAVLGRKPKIPPR